MSEPFDLVFCLSLHIRLANPLSGAARGHVLLTCTPSCAPFLSPSRIAAMRTEPRACVETTSAALCFCLAPLSN